MTKPKSRDRKLESLRRSIRSMKKARDTAKALYKKADALFEAILPQLKQRGSVDMGDGTIEVLVDQFETKNKVFRAHGIERYVLDETAADPGIERRIE